MKQHNLVVSENGRVVIPVIFRKQLGIKAGDEIVAYLNKNNEIILHSPKQSLAKLQQLVLSKNKKGSLVDSLIKMRRGEDN